MSRSLYQPSKLSQVMMLEPAAFCASTTDWVPAESCRPSRAPLTTDMEPACLKKACAPALDSICRRYSSPPAGLAPLAEAKNGSPADTRSAGEGSLSPPMSGDGQTAYSKPSAPLASF